MLRNPFYSVLALVAHLLALAVLFLLLHAEFLAAAQVVVYAGAVMVLYVFVVAYIGGADEPLRPEGGGVAPVRAAVRARRSRVELCIAFIASGLAGARHARRRRRRRLRLARRRSASCCCTDFLVPFEAASFLLLVAAVGAVVLARRRRGLEEIAPAGTRRPPQATGASRPPRRWRCASRMDITWFLVLSAFIFASAPPA